MFPSYGSAEFDLETLEAELCVFLAEFGPELWSESSEAAEIQLQNLISHNLKKKFASIRVRMRKLLQFYQRVSGFHPKLDGSNIKAPVQTRRNYVMNVYGGEGW